MAVRLRPRHDPRVRRRRVAPLLPARVRATRPRRVVPGPRLLRVGRLLDLGGRDREAGHARPSPRAGRGITRGGRRVVASDDRGRLPGRRRARPAAGVLAGLLRRLRPRPRRQQRRGRPPQRAARPGENRIDHLWIRVRDLVESRLFYETVAPTVGLSVHDGAANRFHVAGGERSFALVADEPVTENVHLASPPATARRSRSSTAPPSRPASATTAPRASGPSTTTATTAPTSSTQIGTFQHRSDFMSHRPSSASDALLLCQRFDPCLRCFDDWVGRVAVLLERHDLSSDRRLDRASEAPKVVRSGRHPPLLVRLQPLDLCPDFLREIVDTPESVSPHSSFRMFGGEWAALISVWRP